ncbi:Anti-sigma regulatory factor (Ser/Thr protein kinase) [Klenkia marina]|uniref:Anti-sigma regulatory factor (Ser/Thr protein kinase) n=1 Tax=Klenkia marina TaxID=1960309 RepID=A0A1G4YRY4_9ACTN|nr:ATP-binding protein [Klenkia marina]SCX55688.1 Anti-sigma regulatory factor (Ser/Thr protein kinase) [Klenkia marina]
MTDAPGSPYPRAEPLALDLPADAAALSAVRRAVGRWLAGAGVAPDVVGALQVAVGEACANAVDHAYPEDEPGPMLVRVARGADGRVVAEVSDRGTWRTPDADPGDRGRGLMIMHQLLEDVEVDRGRSGTTVRLRVPARALPERATASGDDLGALRVDRSGPLPRVVASGGLDDDAAAAVRLRLLEGSRGGVVATELDLRAVSEVAAGVVAVVAEVAAIGRANGWALRVLPPPGPVREQLRRAGVPLLD